MEARASLPPLVPRRLCLHKDYGLFLVLDIEISNPGRRVECGADGGRILDGNPASVPADVLVPRVSGNRSSDVSYLCRAGGLVVRALSDERLQGRLLR